MPKDGADMRLAGICRNCMKRLGVDERLTLPLQYVSVSQLPEFDPKLMSGIQFPKNTGATKITYKIAKTVKESIESEKSHRGE